MKVIFTVLFMVICTSCFSKEDSLLVERLNRLELELVKTKQSLDSMKVSVISETPDFTDTFIGLFERYSTRTENLISWSLGLLGLIATVAGYFSIKYVFERINRARTDVIKISRDDIEELRTDLGSQAGEMKNYKKAVSTDMYVLSSNLAVLSNNSNFTRSEVNPLDLDLIRDQSYIFSLIAFEHASRIATEEYLPSATMNLKGGIFNASNIVNHLQAKSDKYKSKKDFLEKYKVVFDQLKPVLLRLVKSDDEEIVYTVALILSKLTTFENDPNDQNL